MTKCGKCGVEVYYDSTLHGPAGPVEVWQSTKDEDKFCPLPYTGWHEPEETA